MPLSMRAGWPAAAVFDFDGVLVDSETCWHSAYEEVARQINGVQRPLPLAALAGASVEMAASQLTHDLGTPVPEGLLRHALHASFAAVAVRPMPGTGALLAALDPALPLAIASNAPPDVLDHVLGRLRLRGWFSAVVSCEETAAPKPAPDVYLEACRRLGVAPEEAVALEDSAPGAAAARQAGLTVVAVGAPPDLELPCDVAVKGLDDPRVLRLLGGRG